MHPSAKCCCPSKPCACGCPCGTEGGLVACDNRVAFPLDADLTLTVAPMSTEFYVTPGGAGAVYQNQSDIDDYIAETDTPSTTASDFSGILLKCKSEFTVSPSTYTITDNTSIGCTTAHVGFLFRAKAMNGDTYEFDAMAGMPRLVNTFSTISTTRRSGNDTTVGAVTNGFLQDFTVIDDDESNGIWISQATVDATASVTFGTSYDPGQRLIFQPLSFSATPGIVRVHWKQTTTNSTANTGSITERVRGLVYQTKIPKGTTGYGDAWPSRSPIIGWNLLTIDQIGTEPDAQVCQGDVDTTYSDPNQGDYLFDVGDRSDAPGSYTAYAPSADVLRTVAPFITASTYKNAMPGTPDANVITDIDGTATVGTRTNPGCFNCDRCFDVTLIETDGDTSAETTIFSGQIQQVVDSRVPPGEDPRLRTNWVTSPIWTGTGITLAKVGPELWTAQIGGATYLLTGGDCPDNITSVCANVTEVPVTTTTGTGTASDPTIHGISSRLKIDTRTFTATPTTCDPCLSDPCDDPCPGTITTWDTGEVDSGDPDYYDSHWEVEDANGSGVYVPAIVLVTDAAWLIPDSPAEWIGIARHDPYGGEPWTGSRTFRTYIEVTGDVPGADITGQLAADNQVLSISVNGIVVATSTGTYTSLTAFTLPAADFFVGMNEILFEVGDDGAVAGLLVEWD